MSQDPTAIEPEGRRALIQGAVIAVVVYAIPFLRFIFSYLTILIHELGHALAGWAFGYPSLPAFDFRYGGGFTGHQDRKLLIVLIVYALLAYVVFAVREHPKLRNLAIGVVAFYSLAAWTPLHEMISIAMGHGAELILAGVFLYRAMTGMSIIQAAERPLYAACGFFILLSGIAFSWGLMTDEAARDAYAAAKGGGHIMDLSRLARDYLGVSVPLLAFVMLIGCFVVPWVSYRLSKILMAHLRERY